MTDQEQERQRQHWQAIAEQLGLSPDSRTPAPGGRKVDSERQPARASDEPEELGRHDSKGSRKTETPAEETSARSSTARVSSSADESDAPEFETAPEPGEVQDESQYPEQARRRRGKRSSRSNAPVAEGPTETGAADASDRQRRSGRGRRKRNGEHMADSPQAEQPTGSDEEDDAETDDFSNWSVPSWNELIASLHRPEH
jgi:hypothetical protein